MALTVNSTGNENRPSVTPQRRLVVRVNEAQAADQSGDRVNGALGGKSRADFKADKKQSDRRAQRISRQDAGHPRADMLGHNRQTDHDRYGDQYFQQYEECRHRLLLSQYWGPNQKRRFLT
ncbi:MAG: hypothetical protein P8Y74_07340 [Desulfobacterales bacterium]